MAPPPKRWRGWLHGTLPGRADDEDPRARRCRGPPGAARADGRAGRRRACSAGLLELLAPGATLIADRAYDTDAIRSLAAELGAWANIPPRMVRKDRFAFSGWVYRQRNCIERFFNRIRNSRGLATRYDRCPENYLAAVKLAATRIWLATYESTP